MKRGPKAELPSTKMARGTFQPCRDGGVVEIVAPDALPVQPEWLTDAGRQVWLDDIGRVAGGKLVTEADSTMFANYCNLQGAISLAWRANEVPPAAMLMEARKMQEMFGLAGAKSRVAKAGGAGGAPSNPFARIGRRA